MSARGNGHAGPGAQGHRFLSAGLPPRFVLISGAILPQILLNVPLTITLVTHGAVFLFLLWYVTPRTMFEQQESAQIAPAIVAICEAERLPGHARSAQDRLDRLEHPAAHSR